MKKSIFGVNEPSAEGLFTFLKKEGNLETVKGMVKANENLLGKCFVGKVKAFIEKWEKGKKDKSESESLFQSFQTTVIDNDCDEVNVLFLLFCI